MPIQQIDSTHWMVQVQRAGERQTRRVEGTRDAALAVERKLVETLIRKREAKDSATPRPITSDAGGPTLRAYYESRWQTHALLMQRETTRDGDFSRWNYLLHYLGDKTLDDCRQPRTIHAFTEALAHNPPLVFSYRRNGQARKSRVAKLSNATINKCLVILKAVLNLAYSEEAISAPPRIDLLPQDDSRAVLAPSDEQIARLLRAAERLRPWAPLLPEVIELACHTGLRRSELFVLAWGNVDWERKALRVESKQLARHVNGQVWKPKTLRFREVPLNERVIAILTHLRNEQPHEDDDPVIPSTGGSPYYPLYRDDIPERGCGKGYFYDAVADAGLKGRVTFHSLRHYFAVRLLTRGAPLAVVSELLGHTNIQLTVKRYGRFSSDAQVKFEAVRLLDDTKTSYAAPQAEEPNTFAGSA